MKPQPVTLRVKAAALLLVMWIAGSATVFYWYFIRVYGVFDQQGLWEQQPLLQQKVQLHLIQQMEPVRDWQAVLITDLDCICNSFAKEHLLRLRQRHPNLAITEMQITDTRLIGLNLVATPLLMLFHQQKLVYAGPLASDFMCSDNNSVFDGIISGTTLLPGFWLNGGSTACRCVTQ